MTLLRTRSSRAAAFVVGAALCLCALTGPAAAAAPVISAYAIPGAGAADTLAIAPAAAGAASEWVIDTAQASATNLIGAATLYALPGTGGAPSAVANLDVQNSGGFGNSFNGGAGVLVNGGSDDYAVSLNGGLIALGAGGVTSFTQVSDLGQGQLAVGAGNTFYAAEGGRGIEAMTIAGDSPQFQTDTLPGVYATGNGGGVASLVSDVAGARVWFATESGQLGCLATAAGGTFSDPYAVTSGASGAVSLSGLPGTLALDGGTLYGVSSSNQAIVAIRTQTPASATVYAVPGSPTINGLTIGPDGNVWFADPGNGAIGELNVTSGVVTEYPLPEGVTLASFDLGNSTTIAPGPAGSGAVFFGALEDGGAAVGVVNTGIGSAAATGGPSGSGCPGPAASSTSASTNGSGTIGGAGSSSSTPTAGRAAAGKLTISRGTVKVSPSRRVAWLKVRCADAACGGRLALTTAQRRKVKGREETVTVLLGVTHYALGRGRTRTLAVKLGRRGYEDLRAAGRHRLRATARIMPSRGVHTTAALTLLVE